MNKKSEFIEQDTKENNEIHTIKTCISAIHKHNDCFSKTVTILMEDGSLKSVTDIKIGDFVHCYDGQNKQVLNNLAGLEKDIYRITTVDGNTIEVTDSHIMRSAGIIKQVRQLSIHDVIDMTHGSLEIVNIEKIEYNDYVYNFILDNGEFIIANGFYAGDLELCNASDEVKPSLSTEKEKKSQEELKNLMKLLQP